MIVKNENYKNKTIALDNKEFFDCTFTNCIIEYAGLSPISLAGCGFIDCKWRVTGAAANTIGFMRAIYHNLGDFGRQLIEDTFKDIKRDDPCPDTK